MDYSTSASHVCPQAPDSEVPRDIDASNQPNPATLSEHILAFCHQNQLSNRVLPCRATDIIRRNVEDSSIFFSEMVYHQMKLSMTPFRYGACVPVRFARRVRIGDLSSLATTWVIDLKSFSPVAQDISARYPAFVLGNSFFEAGTATEPGWRVCQIGPRHQISLISTTIHVI
jgi:hypothetical protein